MALPFNPLTYDVVDLTTHESVKNVLAVGETLNGKVHDVLIRVPGYARDEARWVNRPEGFRVVRRR